MSIKIKKTNRGFAIGEFKDRYGANCSIQESSLASDDAIWFGVDHAEYNTEGDLPRMHLTRDQVNELLPILKHFAETGLLPQPDPDLENEE